MTSRQINSAIVNSLIHGDIKDELRLILDCIHDGIFITDGHGKVLTLNKASLDQCTYAEEEMIGKTMQELINKGMFEDSVSLEAIAQRQTISKVQKGITGQYDLLVTATPYFDEDEIALVIITERDITDLTNLKATLNRLSERYEQEIEYYKAQAITSSEIIYQSSSMRELLRVALRIASTDASLLIQGESGTGKNLIAKFIFNNSPRNKKPFIEINCGAIPENLLESELFGYEKGAFTGANEKGKVGLFELANGGTLFLDEIASMPLQLQVKILRALQEKEIMRVGGFNYIPIDIRFISATNTDLVDAVKDGKFRKDLFYRLNVCQLEIPPLRNRKEDILPLCAHFLDIFNSKYNTNKKFSSSVWRILYSYQWPGNIRELENMLERIIITSDSNYITADYISYLFPLSNPNSLTHDNNSVIDLKAEVDDFEKTLIFSKAKHFHSVTALASALKVDKSTVTRKLRKYNVKLQT